MYGRTDGWGDRQRLDEWAGDVLITAGYHMLPQDAAGYLIEI